MLNTLTTCGDGAFEYDGTDVHPGEILTSEFLKPLGISQYKLAKDTGMSESLVAGKIGVTAETALRLGKYFGTGTGFWLKLQEACDLRRARRRVDLSNVKTLSPKGA